MKYCSVNSAPYINDTKYFISISNPDSGFFCSLKKDMKFDDREYRLYFHTFLEALMMLFKLFNNMIQNSGEKMKYWQNLDVEYCGTVDD